MKACKSKKEQLASAVDGGGGGGCSGCDDAMDDQLTGSCLQIQQQQHDGEYNDEQDEQDQFSPEQDLFSPGPPNGTALWGAAVRGSEVEVEVQSNGDDISDSMALETPRLRNRQGAVLSIVPEESVAHGKMSAPSARGSKRPRTPRAPSPGLASVTLSAAISRQNSLERVKSEGLRPAKRPKRRKSKGKSAGGKKGGSGKSPHAMFEELGCACMNCQAATTILTRDASATSDAIQLDEKSWLECFDKKHRYGANLRPYYQRWLELGTPGKHFWRWLDSEPLVELQEVPRELLEREVVAYLTVEQREKWQVDVIGGLMAWSSNGRALTTPEGEEWIFVVAAADGQMYCHRKETTQNPRFHHTSFLGAEAVRVAGKICAHDGALLSLNLHSGHYRPKEERDLVSFLRVLEDSGCDLSQIRVDVQRIIKSARDNALTGAKRHKRDCEKLWRGSRTVWYLEHQKKSKPFLADIALLRPLVDRALDPASEGTAGHCRSSFLLDRLPGLRLANATSPDCPPHGWSGRQHSA